MIRELELSERKGQYPCATSFGTVTDPKPPTFEEDFENMTYSVALGHKVLRCNNNASHVLPFLDTSAHLRTDHRH